jgi:predicted DCC family thiol-disulfide oxidoreductase YuxK
VPTATASPPSAAPSGTTAASPSPATPATPAAAGLTVLYDGTCGFCTRQARLAQRVGGGPARVTLLSTSLPGVLENRLGLTRESTNRQLFVEDGATGKLYGGAAAVARIVRVVPIVGPVGYLYYLPGLRQLADAVYRLFARNRHRISRLLGWQPLPDDSCADGLCALPTHPSEIAKPQ